MQNNPTVALKWLEEAVVQGPITIKTFCRDSCIIEPYLDFYTSDPRYFKKGSTFKQKRSYNNYFGFTDSCDVTGPQ